MPLWKTNRKEKQVLATQNRKKNVVLFWNSDNVTEHAQTHLYSNMCMYCKFQKVDFEKGQETN